MGEIPFEELHFNWSVLCRLDIREFKVSRRRSLAKMNFRFSQVIYEWLDVFIVASGARFSLQLSMGMWPTIRSQKT